MVPLARAAWVTEVCTGCPTMLHAPGGLSRRTSATTGWHEGRVALTSIHPTWSYRRVTVSCRTSAGRSPYWVEHTQWHNMAVGLVVEAIVATSVWHLKCSHCSAQFTLSRKRFEIIGRHAPQLAQLGS